jgi:hypothetical protein
MLSTPVPQSAAFHHFSVDLASFKPSVRTEAGCIITIYRPVAMNDLLVASYGDAFGDMAIADFYASLR